MSGRSGEDVTRRLRHDLFAEALLLADEARSYFEGGGEAETEALDPIARVRFSCESLKITTRLMHVLAWLMTKRAVDAGEVGPTEAEAPEWRLGESPITEVDELTALPAKAQVLAKASIDLHRRAALLEPFDEPGDSPVRALQKRLKERLV